ncbi:DNA mismatch repair endonuclease MutL [Thaumasiovibrio subtropicus]|uniref:DNA mismatch repair endonuclease MutL n=1 Tax=Thaumasiovibrio subtropicus TaxID=1891207 RepID=UPI000B358AB9|nr:DNA mismatch repair endonuclease MutL [Thaumasiovibrio subtropicus]
MPIQILPARLANQIAAGEVVERPASVVKELVENSLDAGANRIEVDIDKGGSRLIRIRDNGSGIRKDELGLALSRHATSKISTLDDLEAIDSLGFRGEALASISSVARLTLTSRTAEQQEAWMAYAEGRNMEVQLKPAAHPVGTTVEVHDLFFNTPARRKFLRTDKTEFGHIDELLKRIALSRFDTTIIVRHNGKVIRQYRPANTDAQLERRLAAVCGSPFLQHALTVELEHGDLTLKGWICAPEGARAQNDIQYCYVNGRMMKDKLINHAIRQGYEGRLAAEQYAAFVLYIEVDPHQVDVNVHPAKHEVRFHQARLVHDFIYQTVFDALNQGQDLAVPAQRESVVASSTSAPATTETSRKPEENRASEVYRDAIATTTSYPQQAPEQAWREQFSRQSSSQVRDSGQQGRYGSSSPSPQASRAYQALMTPSSEALPQASPPVSETVTSPSSVPEFTQSASEKKMSYDAPADTTLTEGVLGDEIGKAISVIDGRYLVVEHQGALFLASLERLTFLQVRGQLACHDGESLKPQPLLIPLALPVDDAMLEVTKRAQPVLQQLGVILQPKGHKQLMVMGVPQPMRQQNLQVFIPKLLQLFVDTPESLTESLLDNVAKALLGHTEPYSLSQAIALVTEVEQLWQHRLKRYLPFLLQAIDLSAAKKAFE